MPSSYFRARQTIARQELAVLDPHAQPLPPLGRRQLLHRQEEQVDAAIARDVEQRLVAGVERAAQHRQQL